MPSPPGATLPSRLAEALWVGRFHGRFRTTVPCAPCAPSFSTASQIPLPSTLRELRMHGPTWRGDDLFAPSGSVLRMVVNVGARASVSADTFFARGAAAVTLIEALERAGMRVQVDMLSLATNGVGRGQDRLSPQGGGGGHSTRQARVLPGAPGAAPEVELRPPTQARGVDRWLNRRAPRSTR